MSADPLTPTPATGLPPTGTLYVLDAHGLIFQMFHGVGPMSAPDGRPTNAVFGVTRALMDLYDRGADYQPQEGGFAEFIAAVRDGDIVIHRLEQREPLREQLEHFVDCVRTGKEPLTSARDGAAVVRVLERAQEELRRDAAARAAFA